MSRSIRMAGIVLSILFGMIGHALGQENRSSTGRTVVPLTPALIALEQEKMRLDQVAVNAMKAGDYVAAEATARQCLALGGTGMTQEIFAYVLNAQGKTQEALQAYKTLSDYDTDEPRIQVPYATLLLSSCAYVIQDFAFG